MTDLPKVFISEPIHSKGMVMLDGKAILIQAPDTTHDTALRLIKQADAAILRATTLFDQAVIEQGAKLKIIARTGIGVDNVDLAAAGGKGILVCNTPGANDETVAEHTLAVILALAKQVFLMDEAVRQQHWEKRFSPNQVDIKGKKIGIIGYGQIGKATARKCALLDMDVRVFDPFVKQTDAHVTYVTERDTLFAECDFVSLHCPAVAETKNMVNARTLSLMKRNAYLINTSRGDLVDEAALIEHLGNGGIAGAALDVFQKEPLPARHPFTQLPNVILSPHVAGSTREANERIAIAAVQAVLDTLTGKMPQHICNNNYLKQGTLRMTV